MKPDKRRNELLKSYLHSRKIAMGQYDYHRPYELAYFLSQDHVPEYKEMVLAAINGNSVDKQFFDELNKAGKEEYSQKYWKEREEKEFKGIKDHELNFLIQNFDNKKFRNTLINFFKVGATALEPKTLNRLVSGDYPELEKIYWEGRHTHRNKMDPSKIDHPDDWDEYKNYYDYKDHEFEYLVRTHQLTNSSDVSRYLSDHPEDLDKYDLDKLLGYGITHIIQKHPQLFDTLKKYLPKADKSSIFHLIRAQPELHKHFDLEKLNITPMKAKVMLFTNPEYKSVFGKYLDQRGEEWFDDYYKKKFG